MGTRLRLGVALAWALVGRPAAAQILTPITDRDYAIDLYQGPVLGSARIVGMGGASVAVASGSSGLLVNPAAVAVWPATSTGHWDWDVHFDYLNRLPGEDLDNNGVADANAELDLAPFGTAGAAGRWGPWAMGVALSLNQEALPAADETMPDLLARSLVARIGVGVNLLHDTLAIGASIKIGTFEILRDAESGPDPKLFEVSGGAVEVGSIWAPAGHDFRLGATMSTPLAGDDQVELAPDECDPSNCYGYILPNRVTAPWHLAVGGAWRFGPTRWNRKVESRWRDERSLLVAADLWITGTTRDGYGIGAFAQQQLQRSGQDISLSGRVGAEYEWIPGWLRIRAGSYWEPGRFAEVPGRFHLTLGAEARFYAFRLWGSGYRLMFGLTADGAEGYGNGGVTIGFWH